MFNHLNNNYNWPKIKRKNIDGVRHYVDEFDNIYHSVTRVTGILAEDGLKEWREKVGEDVANYVMIKAQNNGTRLHSHVEDYLNNKQPVFENLLSKAHFENIRPKLEYIDNIRGIEVQMCSKSLGLAGTVDCVADYAGVPSIIDFKTSSKAKPEEWIQNYFQQVTAYSLMWEENTGEKIENVVILMSGEDISVNHYIKNRNDYIGPLHETIDRFTNMTMA